MKNKLRLPKWRLLTILCALLFTSHSSLKAQTTLFSDGFESDTINSIPLGWELFGSTAVSKVVFDSGTTNKILRINSGATNPTSYGGEKFQKTLPFGYGDLIVTYNMRVNRLPQATNTTNCGNFNRLGLNGIYNVSNTDNNSANATTSVSPLGLQGIIRAGTGLTLTPSGNFTPVNNVWYNVSYRLTRTSATKIAVTGTIKTQATDSLVKTLTGNITTTTPTLYMNQFIIDITAIYHYNLLDIDSVNLSLPATSPQANNVVVSGIPKTLQTLTGSYFLTGSDTSGTTLQWLTSTSPTGPFTPLPNTNSTTYSVSRSDIGHYLAFRVYPKTASGLVNGVPLTAVMTSPITEHSGNNLIQSIRQTGNVAATSAIKINYTYQNPNNIPEKSTKYTIYVSDSFNVGYFRILATGSTTAAQGVTYAIDTSLIHKYLYVELLPQDSTGAYGLYSGWTAQAAVQPEIQVLNVKYWNNGQNVTDFGLSSGVFTVSADIMNNNPSHDSTGRLIVQLLDGLGNVLNSAKSNGTLLLHNSQAHIVSDTFTIPSYFEGYSIKVSFADSLTGSTNLSNPEKLPESEDVNAVYQYFLNDGDSTNGAYLWIPPHTKTVKGIMICIKNNIEVQIQEYPEVRKVAEKWGLASVVLTMGGATFSNGLLTGLSFDFTNPVHAAKFDSIIHNLAIMSNHPELVNAPFIPMAHSAYMDFPFHVAMRDSSKTICIIPIKSGVPNIYTYYLGAGHGGSSFAPSNHDMKDVPCLFYQGFLPETIDGLFKTRPWRPQTSSLGAGYTQSYRIYDTTDTYKPGNEFGGCLLEQYEGHFNAMPRALNAIAMFIDKSCAARLPDVYPTDPNQKPILKPLDFKTGWLVDQNYFNAHDTTKYNKSAPYTQYKGTKKGAMWFFDQELAQTMENIAVSGYFQQLEQFTINKPDGTPDTLTEAVYCYHPNDGYKYVDSTGHMQFQTTSFNKPWLIDTASANSKDSIKVTPKLYNIMLPGVTSLAVTSLPFKARTNASCYKHLGNLYFKLRYNRYSPSPGGYTQSYVSIYKEGNDSVAPSLRNIRIDRTQSTSFPGLKQQSINFPSTNPIDVNTRTVTLNATATSGLPVEYFVRSGPAVVVGNQLYITQIPDGIKFPIAVSVAAYQIGFTGTTGYYATGPVYSTIWINKISPAAPLWLNGNIGTGTAINLVWAASTDTTVNGYAIYRNNVLIATLTDTTFIDTATISNTTYTYYVKALNKFGNYSDSTNQVNITTAFPLPVSSLSFHATLNGTDKVNASWQIVNEAKGTRYELQRSTDGTNFQAIGNVNANSNGSSTSTYSFTDLLPTPAQPTYFFRLKIVGIDGKVTYSNIVKINTSLKSLAVKVAPNPFKNYLYLTVDAPVKTTATVSIVGISGKTALLKKMDLIQGGNSLIIPEAASLSKGNYILTVTTNTEKKTIKIVKE